MVEKRWRMATKKGKGMRTFLGPGLFHTLPGAICEIPEQKPQPPLPHPRPSSGRGMVTGRGCRENHRDAAARGGEVGGPCRRESRWGLNNSLEGHDSERPSISTRPAWAPGEGTLLVGSSFRQVVEESGNQGVE